MSEAWSVVIKVHSFDSKDEARRFVKVFNSMLLAMAESHALALSIKLESSPPASPGDNESAE